ncbi:hypothetical protein EVAR_24736_1 [Eumeta japonica]|uniref:Uncharacterized protein n=1 Tax=Eumeta variegata TaxID=151549 RepID=A0A4C1VDN1_EUMVA|nr:hypothetical protein EVAR_24736_1 [Eumeta japonica]
MKRTLYSDWELSRSSAVDLQARGVRMKSSDSGFNLRLDLCTNIDLVNHHLPWPFPPCGYTGRIAKAQRDTHSLVPRLFRLI